MSNLVAKEVLVWKAKRQPKTGKAIAAASLTKLVVGLGSAARVFVKIAGVPIP